MIIVTKQDSTLPGSSCKSTTKKLGINGIRKSRFQICCFGYRNCRDWCGWNPWVHYVRRATNWGKPQKNEGWKASNNTQCDGNDEHGSQIPAFWNGWGLGIVISNAAKSAVIQQCDDHQHEHRQNEKTRPILVPWHNSCSQRIITFFAEDDTALTNQGSIYLWTGTNNASLLEQNRPETCLKTENHPQTCFQR